MSSEFPVHRTEKCELAVGVRVLRVRVRTQSVVACRARYSWITRTAIEPSPTAEATRLIEPERPSPTVKTPGQAGLQRQGGAADRVGGAAEVGDLEVDAGEEEAVVVLGEGAVEPLGAGVGADEDEEAADVEVVAPAGLRLLDHDPRARSRHDLADLGVEEDLDVVDRFDLVDQVAGHALRRSRRAAVRHPSTVPERKIAAWPAELPPPTTATPALPHIRDSTSVAA